MPGDSRRELYFSALSIPGSAEPGRPLFSKPTAAGMSAPATACSNWFSLQLFWRAASRRLAGRAIDTHRKGDWPDDLCEVVYIDHFGNAMTGLRALMLPRDARLVATGRVLEPARTFSDRPPGTAFWYENSNGLVEIAVNQGRAERELGLTIGIPIEVVPCE